MKFIYITNRKGKVIGHLEVFKEEDIELTKAFIQGYLYKNDLDSKEALINLCEYLMDKCYILAYHVADYTVLELDCGGE